MDEHKKVCPLEMIRCEYQCGAMIARNEVDQHNKEKMTEHIRLTFKETTTTILNELHNEIRALRNDMPFSNLDKDVAEVHKNVNDLREEFSDLRKGISGQGAQLEIGRQDNMLVSPISCRSHFTIIVLCVIVSMLTVVLLQSHFTATLDPDCDTQHKLSEKILFDGTQEPDPLRRHRLMVLSLTLLRRVSSYKGEQSSVYELIQITKICSIIIRVSVLLVNCLTVSFYFQLSVHLVRTGAVPMRTQLAFLWMFMWRCW